MKTVKFVTKVKDLAEVVKECYRVCEENKVQSLSIHPFGEGNVVCFVKMKGSE